MPIIVGVPEQEIEERWRRIRRTFRPTDEDREQLFNDQSGLCPICTPLYGSVVGSLRWEGVVSEVDHAVAAMTYACMNIPIEDAIKLANDKKNRILAHMSCNRQKNNRDLDYLHKLIEDDKCSLTEPKNLTDEEIEARRVQHAENSRKGGRKGGLASGTPEQRSERSRKMWASKTPEERSGMARKREASKTPEQRSEQASKAGLASAAVRTPEQKLEYGHKAGLASVALMTPEQLSERGRKACHVRDHVKIGILKPECVFCQQL